MTPWTEVGPGAPVFDPRVRNFCAGPPRCPNYDASWACPPAAPYLEREVRRCDRAFLVWYEFDLEAFAKRMGRAHPHWSERMKRNPRLYSGTLRKSLRIEVGRLLEELGVDSPRTDGVQVLWAGTCRACKVRGGGGCSYPREPCRHPDRRQYSMEAVGIDVDATCRAVGVHLQWPPQSKAYHVALVFTKGRDARS
ncbi:MAG: hypothetical protein Kow0069_17890 [Promethearchaeota archaeon]